MQDRFWFAVDETVDVVGQDGATVIGRVSPGSRYQALSADQNWVTMTGPGGAFGYIPLGKVRKVEASPAAAPPSPPPPPPSGTPIPGGGVAAAAAAPSQGPAMLQGVAIRRKLTFFSGAAAALAVFLDWLTGVNALEIPLTVFLNLDSDLGGLRGGYVLLAAAAAVMVLGITVRARPGLVRLLGALFLAAAASLLVQYVDGFFDWVGIGWYLAVAAGLAIIIAPSRDT